ncbi:MAG TPA: lysyl-tRNA synthetase [Phycicoccus sp.]|nr:lysyl-tRNA synthetase [Phycicoccus sp.]HQH06382.1 lysyl-tRNA synthetase [Phycicoccus sp.]HQK30197.1 lysyl-tRNA synthetase [Phycicoccus sp.]HQV90327.1 lysyl-tRNA synthetase [Phycicoccus sp.]HRA46359.1 lysyl-tRNA synthetase [Phycicoccus sp.]
MPDWWNAVWPYLAAIIPTIFVAILFYFLIKAIIESDRRERLAQSKWEAEQKSSGESRS